MLISYCNLIYSSRCLFSCSMSFLSFSWFSDTIFLNSCSWARYIISEVLNFFSSYPLMFVIFRLASYFSRVSFFLSNSLIQLLSCSMLNSKFFIFLLFYSKFRFSPSFFSIYSCSRFLDYLLSVFNLLFYCSSELILSCNFFIAAAIAEPSPSFLSFFYLDEAKLSEDLSWRGGWAFPSMLLIFYFAFCIEVVRMLSMFALFSVLGFFYLCYMIDCTKLSCSARLRSISLSFSADMPYFQIL